MKSIFLKLLFVAAFFCVSFVSCKDEINSTDNEIPEAPLTNPYSSAHFTFYYTSYDSLFIKAIADTLEHNYSRILADLVTDTVVKTSVHFYKTYDELVLAVNIPNLPSWAIGLATAKDQIHMLSPKLPELSYNDMLNNLIHEFAHCVSLNINAAFGNRPRWLWESVAIFEAGQFTHPSHLQYMVQQNPPTLSQLNSINNVQIYEVGYLLAEYIVENWSRQHLKDMIINYGNIKSSLNMTTSEFESAWFQFVKNKYGI